ncbi:MAG: hypothetical protein AAFV54_08985, partial [Pseudomonadota bacterium]
LPEATAQVRQNFALILALNGKFEEAREVASIDASEYIAEKNIDFIAQMIGESPQLERIADAASAQSVATEPTPVQPTEVPKAAPTTVVETETLSEPIELASEEPHKPRLRGTLSGGR